MKSAFKFILLSVVICAIAQSSLSAQNSYKENSLVSLNFYKAKKYLNSKKYIEALGYYQTALIYDPYNTAPLIMAGNTCIKLDLFASAIDYYKMAIEISDSPAAYNNLGNIYGTIGYDELSLKAFENIDNEDHVNKLIALGAIAERHGNYTEALKYMHRASKIATNYTPWYNLGVIYMDINNLDRALFYFDKVIEIAPDEISGYSAKLEVFVKMGKPEKEYFPLCEKVIDLCSKKTNNYNILKMKAEAHRLLNQKSKMEADLKKCLIKLDNFIELYPESYPFITDRAEVYKDLENREAAIADYKRALQINPNYDKTKNGYKELLENESNDK